MLQSTRQTTLTLPAILTFLPTVKQFLQTIFFSGAGKCWQYMFAPVGIPHLHGTDDVRKCVYQVVKLQIISM